MPLVYVDTNGYVQTTRNADLSIVLNAMRRWCRIASVSFAVLLPQAKNKMSMLRSYMKNEEGVHVMALAGGEISLCGDAWDIGVENIGLSNMANVPSGPVTCQGCIDIIDLCRSVRVKRHTITNKE